VFRTAAIFIALLLSNQANAQDCPSFYRFVDFGLEGNDGRIYRGGTTFRAESFDGQSLILKSQTKCRAVREISKDGHGNPIPVVSSVDYDPSVMDVRLDKLNISIVDSTDTIAKESAKSHQDRVARPDAKLTRGSNFLCVTLRAKDGLSCQLVSPYSGNRPLYVYCDVAKCTMPVLAIDSQLAASAGWPSDDISTDNPSSAGIKISKKVFKIHDFLKPLSAAL
jgi:hypothetical protein